MKQQADQKRSEREFVVGHWVYLRLQPYKQASIKRGGKHKLSPKFYGPYKILRRVGEVAYVLELPKSSKIHNTFHVSSLKRVVGQMVTVQTELSELDEEGKLQLEPEAILKRRTRQLRHRNITEYLIKWQRLPLEDATWEGEDIFQQYPNFVKL